MLELSEAQLQELARLDARDYVDRVHDDVLEAHPELNAAQLRERLYRAFDHAMKLGLRDGGAATQFLTFEALAPEFYRDPAIDAWLRKPDASPEQRWADLIATMKSKLPREEE